MQESLIQQLRRVPRHKAEAFVRSLTDLEAAGLAYDWSLWARPNQLPPNDPWAVWLVKTGRGWGKTRTGAEMVREWAKHPGWRIALCGKQPDDYRGTMIEGEAGILAVCPPWDRPKWYPSASPPMLEWSNGAKAFCYSSETPDALRGPSHHKAWVDELAKFKKPVSLWDMLMLGMRLGDDPQVLVTTTPRPIKLIKDLMKHPLTRVVSGSTHENLDNLSPLFRQTVLSRYEGTRLGRQEVYGEMLGDTPGALWTLTQLETNRRTEHPSFDRVVIAVDPSAADEPDAESAETGIIAGGLGVDGHGYVLEDCSLQGSPHQWATAAVAAYHTHEADCLIAEANNGGAMVKATIHSVDDRIPVKLVYASRGKHTRAEPISALDEQGRLHLLGYFKELEDQLTTWVPGMKSPDRLDAYVWCFTELLGASVAQELYGGGAEAPVVSMPHNGQEIDAPIMAQVREIGQFWPGR